MNRLKVKKTYLWDESGLFQEILLDFSALDGSLFVEMYVDVFAKATWVVIAYGLRIAKRFQNRIRFQYLLLNPIVLTTDGG